MALNDKQRIFVSKYVKYRNATRAARLAGYSPKTAYSQGSELLKHPEIARAIEKRFAGIEARAELKASDVLAEIKKLAFVNLSQAYGPDGALLHPHDMPKDLQAALQSVETDELFVNRRKRKIGVTKKIKLSDKVRALEMLAKHFKLLTDVQEISGRNGETISVNLTMPSNGSEVPTTEKDNDDSAKGN